MPMAWFRKEKTPKQQPTGGRGKVPEGLWLKCPECKQLVYKKEVSRNLNVCPKCDHHFRISARDRIALLLDEADRTEFDADIAPKDALGFEDTRAYADRLVDYQRRLGVKDALISMSGRIGGFPVILAVMEYGFMGGSMGSVVGEKVTRAAERALRERAGLIVVCCSGGARMQEGALSLMQMAKISAALARLDQAGLPYISVLTDPTTGGVTASFAMLGDFNIAEPRALIGFAGPRVIEQTIRQKLPKGFQRAEFLVEHGMVDRVVQRRELRDALTQVLAFSMEGRDGSADGSTAGATTGASS